MTKNRQEAKIMSAPTWELSFGYIRTTLIYADVLDIDFFFFTFKPLQQSYVSVWFHWVLRKQICCLEKYDEIMMVKMKKKKI